MLAVYEYFADFTAESYDGIVSFAFSHFDLVFFGLTAQRLGGKKKGGVGVTLGVEKLLNW